MKPSHLIVIFWFIFSPFCFSQNTSKLNTAQNCSYMKQIEKEMICEINLLRSDPSNYIQYLQEEYDKARLEVAKYGKGKKSYSISRSYETIDGREKLVKTDTVWNNINEEELKAIEDLIQELKKMKPLSILQPDKGLYSAAVKHAGDQTIHHWSLGHRGSDGSWPWDRIKKYSPKMKDGNENLAGKYPEPTAREILILLLIDSGIPGYGHRENILNPVWTHGACYSAGLHEGMYQWVQEFGNAK